MILHSLSNHSDKYFSKTLSSSFNSATDKNTPIIQIAIMIIGPLNPCTSSNISSTLKLSNNIENIVKTITTFPINIRALGKLFILADLLISITVLTLSSLITSNKNAAITSKTAINIL